MRRKTIDIWSPSPWRAFFHNVNMNYEHSSKTNKLLKSEFRSAGSGGIPEGRPVPAPASFPPGLQSSMKKIAAAAAGASTAHTSAGTAGQKPRKVQLARLQPYSPNETTQSLTERRKKNKCWVNSRPLFTVLFSTTSAAEVNCSIGQRVLGLFHPQCSHWFPFFHSLYICVTGTKPCCQKSGYQYIDTSTSVVAGAEQEAYSAGNDGPWKAIHRTVITALLGR